MKYLTFLSLAFLVVACGNSTGNDNNNKDILGLETSKVAETDITGSSVLFSRINNKAKVFVDDSLIYESKTILSGYDVDEKVNLDPFVSNGAEVIRIELFNGVEPYDDQIDQKWEIMYDLILEGEVVDFVNESIYENKIGRTYEASYKIEEWVFDSKK
ncbi:hypothetical protein [Ekhidna sp.]|uniref:hypothetical protein n=1 Tax=Ekhidna sp. TaxID=2608089 RepID=UPI003B5C29AB